MIKKLGSRIKEHSENNKDLENFLKKNQLELRYTITGGGGEKNKTKHYRESTTA